MIDIVIKLAQELKREQRRRIALEEQSVLDSAKVVFADAVEGSSGTILVGDLAKILRDNGVEIEPEGLFSWLRENGYLMNMKGEIWNLPTRESQERGLLEVEKAITHKAMEVWK